MNALDVVRDDADAKLATGIKGARAVIQKIFALMMGEASAEAAFEGSTPGSWLCLEPKQVTANHEAGHALGKWLCGLEPGNIIVFSHPINGIRGLSNSHANTLEEAEADAAGGDNPSDFEKIEVYRDALVRHGYRDPSEGLKKGMAKALIKHRRVVRSLAGIAFQRRFLDAGEVAEILAKLLPRSKAQEVAQS